MTRKFCWITTILILIFALSAAGWAQQKPNYLEEKEQAAKVEKLKEPGKPERLGELEKLKEELEEMQAKLEELPPDSDEAEHIRHRIATIRRRIAEVEAKRLAKLPSREMEARIEELRKKVEKDEADIKKLEYRLAEQKEIVEKLIAQSKEVRPEVELKIFQLKHVDLEIVAKIVERFMTPNLGILVPVSHTNSIIVRDIQSNLHDIETIVKHVDVEGKPKEIAPEKPEKEGEEKEVAPEK